MKVMTVVGTRPELIKLSCVIQLLDKHVDHVLVHTGQNFDYELNGIFYEELGVRQPDYFLEAAGASAGETVGLVIEKVDKLLAKEKPDKLIKRTFELAHGDIVINKEPFYLVEEGKFARVYLLVAINTSWCYYA